MVQGTTVRRRQFLKSAGAASALIGVGSTAGCTGQGDQGAVTGGGSQQEVHFLTEENSEAAKKLYAELSQAFTDETGIPVVIEYTGLGTTFDQRMTTLVQTGNPPEAAQLEGSHALGFHYQDDLMEPVTDIMETVESTFNGSFGDNRAKFDDGEDYLATLWGNIYAQTYRTDLYEEAGYSSPASTWEEQYEIYSSLSDVISEDMSVAGHTFVAGGPGDAYTRSHAFSKGVEFWDHSGDDIFSGYEVVLDQGENLKRATEALLHCKELGKYTIDPNMGISDVISTYYTGKTTTGEYYGFRPFRQALINNYEDVGQYSAPMACPTPADGEARYSGQIEGYGVFSGSEHPEAGKKWIEFILAGDGFFDLATTLSPVHNMPLIPSIYEDERYLNGEFFQEYGIDLDTFDVIRNQIVPNLQLNWKDLDGNANPYGLGLYGSAAWGIAANNVVVKDMDPETALTQCADQYRQILSDNDALAN